MTPRQENELALLVGQLIGELKGMKTSLDSLQESAREAVEWRHEVKDRMEKMENHGLQMSKVAAAFDALQKAIHEGTIQAKAYSKGILIGVGLAAGGTGAFVSTGIKWLYTTLVGA